MRAMLHFTELSRFPIRRINRQLRLFIALFSFTLILFSSLIFQQKKPSSPPTVTPPATVQPTTVPLSATPSSTPSGQVQGVDTTLYPVVEVADGDTIKVLINDKKETVRFIGIDTPETISPRKPVQCFSKEASEKMKALVLEKSVQLIGDETQTDRDRYNRQLRYVFLEDGTFVNYTMILEGFAHEYTHDLPYKYQAEFKAAEKDARTQGRGLWAKNACEIRPKSL